MVIALNVTKQIKQSVISGNDNCVHYSLDLLPLITYIPKCTTVLRQIPPKIFITTLWCSMVYKNFCSNVINSKGAIGMYIIAV